MKANKGKNNQEGTALLGVLVVFLGVLGIVQMTTTVSSVEVQQSRRDFDATRVRQVAEAGVHRGLLLINQTIAKANGANPLSGIETLFDGDTVVTPYLAEPLMDGANQVGAYTVSMEILSSTPTSIEVEIRSSGYLPDAPQALAPGERTDAWRAISATVVVSLLPSEVFDYAYFINNWGWFYGNTIFANGNVRSNGQFDVANFSPTVTGQPMYEGLTKAGAAISLDGYIDDNGDGLEDGNDGGIFSSWDIVKAGRVKGNGGQEDNQHDFQDSVDMPNLSNLAVYEAKAITEGGNISIGGTVMTNAVFGDEVGEQGSIYLVGTAADPIVLDGPVVINGDVIISGYVTGQGAIYAEGNVYVPESIRYLDGPSTTRPTDNTTAETEQWIEDNWDKDFLGLFAKENVVVGDHTDPTWRFYVGGWMSSGMNSSVEDAGIDGIPNTAAGRDGVYGTADDDLLEGDGVFTTLAYTDEDAELGLIPAGFSVGDSIPGTGEDIDGDGFFDATTTLADIDLSSSLDSTNWGGNMPLGGVANYSDISSLYANNLDAVFYTNHSFCYTVLGGTPAQINGAVVCRNENIVYGTPSVSMNYDSRLLGGVSGMAGDLLPRVIAPAELTRWVELDRDPNRYIGVPVE